MPEHQNPSTVVELKALQAIVRALGRTVVCQSSNGLSDLLTCLQIEANRLAVIAGEGDAEGLAVVDALGAWAETLMHDEPALVDVEAGEPGGRPVHFLD